MEIFARGYGKLKMDLREEDPNFILKFKNCRAIKNGYVEKLISPLELCCSCWDSNLGFWHERGKC